MYAAPHARRAKAPLPAPIRRRAEPKSLALLVDIVLARYGILPLDADQSSEPARHQAGSRRSEQTLLFPVT